MRRDNFPTQNDGMFVDTANESQVAGLSFAVSTTIWAPAVQFLFNLVTPSEMYA